MSEAHEGVVKIIAILASLIALWIAYRTTWVKVGRRKEFVLWSLVTLGALGYVNFGGFHTDGTPFHIWDQYHYVIGSKYFPELGYDGIYAATLVALKESDSTFVLPSRMRDIRTNRVVLSASQDGFMREVRARFSDERWAFFKADVSHFYLGPEIFLDHGYNPTPAHAAIERIFTSHLPFRQLTAALFAALDFGLLALAGVVVYRTFGLETLAAVSLVFGLGICSRYYWVGGAFLRQDWLVALFIGVAALARGRERVAGAALAYAACSRVFPVLMLLPFGVFAISRWKQPQSRRESLRFAQGFTMLTATLLIVGCLAGRGPGAWAESAQRLLVHGSVSGPNAIGLRVPFSASLANLRGDLVDPTTLYDYTRISADVAKTGHDHLVFIVLATILMLAVTLRVAWRVRDAATAFVAGICVIYAMTTPSCYYGSFFALLAIVRPARTAIVFLLASLLMYLVGGSVLMLALHGFIHLNGAAMYVPVSILLLFVLVDWLFGVSQSAASRGFAESMDAAPIDHFRLT